VVLRCYWVAAALLGLALVILALVFAPVFLGLTQLPIVGAPRISLDLAFDPPEAVTNPRDAIHVLFRIGIQNHGPGVVRDARVRVSLCSEAPHLAAYQSDAFGGEQRRVGERLPDTGEHSGLHWVERHDFDEDPLPLHYTLQLFEKDAGLIRARVMVRSKNLLRDCVEEAVLHVKRG
jgi:hypothetical protein